MEDKRNLLVTLADKNFIDQAKQLFSSAYWNAGWKGDYMLLSHEIPEKELKWFRDKGILVKKYKPFSDKGWRYWPPTLLNKFYLFTPEFKRWKNIVYLDADIIVRASLDGLTKVKGFGSVKIIGVTLQKLIKTYFKNISRESASEKTLDILQKEDYKLKSPVFGAGLIVFNTDIIDKNTFIELKQIFKHKKFPGSEEIVLNLFFYNKWKKLPLIYNVYPNHLKDSFNILLNPNHLKDSFNILKWEDRAIILHFAITDNLPKERPWHPINPFYEEWKSNLERAELIDLKNIPKGKKWSKFRIYWNSLYLRIRSIPHFLYTFFDRLIGKFGIFLKKYNPELYHKLKKFLDSG